MGIPGTTRAVSPKSTPVSRSPNRVSTLARSKFYFFPRVADLDGARGGSRRQRQSESGHSAQYPHKMIGYISPAWRTQTRVPGVGATENTTHNRDFLSISTIPRVGGPRQGCQGWDSTLKNSYKSTKPTKNSFSVSRVGGPAQGCQGMDRQNTQRGGHPRGGRPGGETHPKQQTKSYPTHILKGLTQILPARDFRSTGHHLSVVPSLSVFLHLPVIIRPF